ncbi:hypothetical protein JL721_6971 [Aureococcus anophagefferens]|nr:hypothetical protein JL721_6971 [Aureococcus anophagefferens]
MVTIEKGAPCRRPRFISFDETAFDAPGPGPSRKRGAAGLDGFESAGSASSCGSEACTPLRLDFDAWDSDGDDSAASAGFRSPSPTKRRRPAPPTVRRKSCLARPGDSPYTPEVDRLAALSPGRLEELKRLTLRNLECFAGDGLAVRVQLDELRERLVEAASGGSGDDASDPHTRRSVAGPLERRGPVRPASARPPARRASSVGKPHARRDGAVARPGPSSACTYPLHARAVSPVQAKQAGGAFV